MLRHGTRLQRLSFKTNRRDGWKGSSRVDANGKTGVLTSHFLVQLATIDAPGRVELQLLAIEANSM